MRHKYPVAKCGVEAPGYYRWNLSIFIIDGKQGICFVCTPDIHLERSWRTRLKNQQLWKNRGVLLTKADGVLITYNCGRRQKRELLRPYFVLSEVRSQCGAKKSSMSDINADRTAKNGQTLRYKMRTWRPVDSDVPSAVLGQNVVLDIVVDQLLNAKQESQYYFHSWIWWHPCQWRRGCYLPTWKEFGQTGVNNRMDFGVREPGIV